MTFSRETRMESDRGPPMKAVPRFFGALALVLSLLVAARSLALGLGGSGAVGHQLWGAYLVAAGLAIVLGSWKNRNHLPVAGGENGEAQAPSFSAHELLGEGLAVAGAAYGLSGEVWVLVVCLLIIGIIFEFWFSPSELYRAR